MSFAKYYVLFGSMAFVSLTTSTKLLWFLTGVDR